MLPPSSPSSSPSLTYQRVSASLELSSQPSNNSTPENKGGWKLLTCFWMLGLFNNASYVIMLACAKSISEGGTALVFLANVLPSFLIKASSPYWFDKVAYDTRLWLATIFMMTSFVLVATGSRHSSPNLELLGVAIGSFQGGLGEASLLALAGKSDSGHGAAGKCLTCFSSGTGMAGVFGFFWKWFWNDFFQLSLSATLWLANVLGVAYWMTFQYCNAHPGTLPRTNDATNSTEVEDEDDDYEQVLSPARETQALTNLSVATEKIIEGDEEEAVGIIPISEMTSGQRLQLVLSLWLYMIPLFVVYASEYALQSGTWSAIGFPLESEEARNQFFEYSNWLYQAGVFVSRSSGTLFVAPMLFLWIMPVLQALNLGIFWYIASHPTSVLYDPLILYTGACYTGLLGGAVYIHGYKRICQDLPLPHREFALSATSVAESIGIVVADLVGLFIQACLYQINGLEGALVTCPAR